MRGAGEGRRWNSGCSEGCRAGNRRGLGLTDRQVRDTEGSIVVGRNSKARRDARRRKRTRQGQGSTGPKPGSPFWDGGEFTVDPVAFADLRVVAEVRRLGLRGSEEEALRRAGSLHRERVPGWAL